MASKQREILRQSLFSESKYKLTAPFRREKMYKDKFKSWKWNKNLPREKAAFMLHRINQRKPERIKFLYGNRTWTEDRIRQTYERYNKTSTAGDALASHANQSSEYGATPSDIEYGPLTPVSAMTPQEAVRLPGNNMRHARRDLEPGRADVNIHPFDQTPIGYELSRPTLSDLRILSDSAIALAAQGDNLHAEDQFREALVGYRHILSPTHDETVRAGYLLASFYANNGRFDEANFVLEWMSKRHRERWGATHKLTLLHALRIIELLRSWGRLDTVETILYKILGGLGDIESITESGLSTNPVSSVHTETSSSILMIREKIDNLAGTTDSSTINYQLKLIDILLAHSPEDLSGVLTNIIAQCETYPGSLKTQAIQSRAALAKVYASKYQIEPALAELKAASQCILPALTLDESPPSREFTDAVQNVAFLYLEINYSSESANLLNNIVAVHKARIGFDKDEEHVHFVVDFLLTIASEFHRRLGWGGCRQWVEQAFGIARSVFGQRSSEARRLEKMLARQCFEFTDFRSIDDLMKSSKGYFRLKLV